jgi:protein-L-isoaspartate(D-aspartate) O-methyltransferase
MSEEAERARMVREQLEARDVHDPRVLDAMRRVPRHLFVPEKLRAHAYEDRPQPIGEAQTISQPLMVGLMTELLEVTPSDRVLEIGTGSGYQAAVLAELAAEVVSIERHECLAARARELLEWLGYRTVRIEVGDGTEGWPELAPYDRIVVTAGAPSMPPPLIEQLKPGGKIVAPIGGRVVQTLTLGWKDEAGAFRTAGYGECVFVPLIGKYGWRSDGASGD